MGMSRATDAVAREDWSLPLGKRPVRVTAGGQLVTLKAMQWDHGGHCRPVWQAIKTTKRRRKSEAGHDVLAVFRPGGK
jgi:hypothetical protein